MKTFKELKEEHEQDCRLDFADFTVDEHRAILDREADLIKLIEKVQVTHCPKEEVKDWLRQVDMSSRLAAMFVGKFGE